MCVFLVAQKPTPEIELLILHNRDEFVDRPFSVALWREEGKHRIISGRDQKASGTWLAMTDKGAFSTVLNIRQPGAEKTQGKSRGELPLRALLDSELPLALKTRASSYRPFNLVWGGPGKKSKILSSYNDTSAGRVLSSVEVEDSVFGLSNHPMPLAPWKKTERLIELFRAQITPEIPLGEITRIGFEILGNKEKALFSELPEGTGRTIEVEHELSSVFVALPKVRYQTVVSTVAMFTKSGEVIFQEKRHSIIE
jgi:uncharacterized protein with NRDE domain